MSLRTNVHQLCSEHLTTGPDGKPVKVPALLDQLSNAVTAETRAGSSGSGGRSLPIGEGALSLLQDIEREARDHQYEMVAHESKCSLRTLLGMWANGAVTTPEWEVFLEHATLDWSDRITAIVNPSKPPRKLHRPCPACGVQYGGDERKPGLHLHCWDSAGELAPPGDWTAECIHCGAGWDGSELGWLSRAVSG